MLRRAPLALLPALAALACGPNYRYAYDGEAAFERCYALDFEGSVTPADRASCWSAWLQTYAYGANPDRLDYARNRLTASGTPGANAAPLNPTAPPPPTAPAGPIVANTGPASPPATTPAPATTGSVGALPLTAPPPTAPAPTTTGEPPGSTCSGECRASWGACGGRCTNRDAACEARCDDIYRDCMRGCF